MNQNDIKDLNDKIAELMGRLFQDTKIKVKTINQKSLLNYSHNSPQEWYLKQTAQLTQFNREIKSFIDKEYVKALKQFQKTAEDLNLSDSQLINIQRALKKGYRDLKATSIFQHKKDVVNIKVQSSIFKNDIAENFQETIWKELNKNTQFGVVQYSNGRNVKWENYMEMNIRTTLNQDITANLIKAGSNVGVVFYIVSHFGDCAEDHAEAQAKSIYYDENYEVEDDKLRDEIETYIKTHKLDSIQQVTEYEPFLTTRPNCRHYFTPISTEEVLGFRTNQDINNYRENNGLNFNGKYNPEKYEALSKLRKNERSLRELKGQIQANDLMLGKNIDNDLKTRLIANNELLQRNIRNTQKEQVKLTKENKFLTRSYDREQYRKFLADFGYNR